MDDQLALLLLSDETPFVPPDVPRTYAANMCGIRVPGLQPVLGGSSDASLVLSWFYDRYDVTSQAKIRAAWKSRGDLDVLVSWPDSRAYGFDGPSFVAMCHSLQADGFRPCVFLYSKDQDPTDAPGILANCLPVLNALLMANAASRICIGWELSIALSPTTVQELIDTIAPKCVAAGVKCYVHFGQAIFAWQPDGLTTADFWRANVGKLTGILHQRKQTGTPDDPPWDPKMYQARLVDCLQRFAGQFNFPTENGIDGNPFDLIACEITAVDAFNGAMDEFLQNEWGQIALTTPPVGTVKVMGSGNGF